uniref:Retinol dehydrogenase 16 n=1 Tax=Capra hircus TaxID=9925 RepID=A0A452G554_CAPHI
MSLYLVVLIVLYCLLRWDRERQVVSHLQDKFIFITGCDSGLGNRLARQLDLRGLRVLAACLTEQGAEQLRNQTTDSLQTVILDVTKTENVTDFVKALDVNLLGVIDVTLSLLPLVRKARGRVVNVSSVLGRVSIHGGGYCISKKGVEAFSDSLRRELSYFGVKVAMIEPGYFVTNMTQGEGSGYFQALWNQAIPEVKELYGENFPSDATHGIMTLNLLKPPWTQDLSLVTDCMEHALTACHPRTRYLPGWDAKFIYLPMSYLPSFLMDLMVYWYYPQPAKAL